MSQSVGSPFMCDTMLRSGVPPHIGQSPVSGSDVDSAASVSERTNRINFMGLLGVCRQFQIIQIRTELRVDEKSRRALPIADRIDLLDRPRGRFSLSHRPRFTTRPY